MHAFWAGKHVLHALPAFGVHVLHALPAFGVHVLHAFWAGKHVLHAFDVHVLHAFFQVHEAAALLALPHNSPKTKPVRPKPPPGNHGTFEKSSTKPPPGLTARLMYRFFPPPTPATKNHDGGIPHAGRDRHAGQAPNDHPTKSGSPTTAEPQTPARWRPPGQATQAPARRAQPGSLGIPPNPGRQHGPARQNRQERRPIPRPGHKTGITRSRPQSKSPYRHVPEHPDIIPGHHRHPPFHGPAFRAGPNRQIRSMARQAGQIILHHLHGSPICSGHHRTRTRNHQPHRL